MLCWPQRKCESNIIMDVLKANAIRTGHGQDYRALTLADAKLWSSSWCCRPSMYMPNDKPTIKTIPNATVSSAPRLRSPLPPAPPRLDDDDDDDALLPRLPGPWAATTRWYWLLCMASYAAERTGRSPSDATKPSQPRTDGSRPDYFKLSV